MSLVTQEGQEMDPEFITTSDWSAISSLLTHLWFIPLLVIVAAFLVLTAHAIIPSLITTGHLSEGFHQRRAPLYGLAALAIGGALFFLVRTLVKGDVAESFWPRFWM